MENFTSRDGCAKGCLSILCEDEFAVAEEAILEHMEVPVVEGRGSKYIHYWPSFHN